MKKLNKLKFTSCFFDHSGYAKASRQNALALHKAGVELTLNPVSFEQNTESLGKDEGLLRSLVHKDLDYDAHLIQLTPEHFPNLIESSKKTIGYTVWENDRLFPSWPGFINGLDKVITGSEWGKDVFIKSGVTIPVGVCSHCVEDIDLALYKDTYDIRGLSPETFVFGDVFQWLEKKGAFGLIRAYWATFTKKDNVALVLKTYRSSFAEQEKAAIIEMVKRIKGSVKLDYYPPIYLVLDLLSDDQVNALHRRFDCYISLDRGEGVGLGPLIAGSFATPIIVTGWGGSLEYAKPEHSHLVNYTLEPCFGDPHNPWSRGDQLWAHADLGHASRLMREVYENRSAAKGLGKKFNLYVKEHFSYEAIGKKLVDEIEEIL